MSVPLLSLYGYVTPESYEGYHSLVYMSVSLLGLHGVEPLNIYGNVTPCMSVRGRGATP